MSNKKSSNETNSQTTQTIGDRIKLKRCENGLSKTGLADEMHVTRRMIYSWEEDTTSLRIDDLLSLCKVLNTSIDYIILGDDAEITNKEINDLLKKCDFSSQHKLKKVLVNIIESFLPNVQL